jgi:hypothetical protein
MTFQQLVDHQHDEAAHHIAVSTTALVVGSSGAAAGHALHEAGAHVASRAVERAALVGVPIAESVIVDSHAPEAHRPSRLQSVATGAANGAFDAGMHVLFGPLALASGAVAQVRSMMHTLEDGDARAEFQRAASVYDANRQQAITAQRTNQGQGRSAGQLAATGNAQIDWSRFERDGDYAAGVRRGLSEALARPADFAWQYGNRQQ